ncbi:LEAF RUST 10 DISEASE-RESISTANCE LOCUS RECEPTOR-LIKE PROTEIN KINASE-like 1.2 [Andrographis paniculata]|uniref:LEAF RUST 10 DISEASE-RESISTANCE LOCUS RECEPTOR-LIKE PROTEIN KINASE-like 1.2 n=1 Tax=Andrographis paniculata TaxID=175694 RepID=UPI0021E838B6|nr:LEAF RUST 10 DISEASE-RESISTANCE LOCUS RECEPTOR-LIKE PROTEIN KINASE-like 1.2 [Andrographis paniculata]
MQLRCSRENLTTIDLAGQSFVVLEIGNRSMRIARLDMWNGFCLRRYESTWLSDGNGDGDPQLKSSVNVENLYLFYSCYSDFEISARNRFDCGGNGTDGVRYLVDESLQAPIVCGSNITLPVMSSAVEKFRLNETTTLEEVVNGGFEVEYVVDRAAACTACEMSGGHCRPENNSAAMFVCSHSGNGLNLGLKLTIGFVAAALSAITMCILFSVYHRRYNRRYNTRHIPLKSNGTSSCSMVEDLKRAGIHIFDYHKLEQATDNFDAKRELGDGSFGVVYRGKLDDGRIVAVKRLYEHHYRRVEQFRNEIEILSHLRHQNLVTLYGCTSMSTRELILVYEYIPNGTLADHLYGARANPGSLPWITRLKIAVETASALSYLHASGVIHRDIKSTNILLDNNFGVKVADFGLSRLRPSNATHVTTAPQGTPGYVDPEYYECYELTEKSDVYSFGVVLMELISSLPAIDITRARDEINLSMMAINRIQRRRVDELVDGRIGVGREREMAAEAAEVAFGCLQSVGEMRPDMESVFDVLQGIKSKMEGSVIEVMDIPKEDLLQLKKNSSSQSVSPQ